MRYTSKSGYHRFGAVVLDHHGHWSLSFFSPAPSSSPSPAPSWPCVFGLFFDQHPALRRAPAIIWSIHSRNIVAKMFLQLVWDWDSQSPYPLLIMASNQLKTVNDPKPMQLCTKNIKEPYLHPWNPGQCPVDTLLLAKVWWGPSGYNTICHSSTIVRYP